MGESCGKNAVERRLGGVQAGIKIVPARRNAKYAMVATECAAMGVDWMA